MHLSSCTALFAALFKTTIYVVKIVLINFADMAKVLNRKYQKQVPVEMYNEIEKMVESHIYKNHPSFKPIYEAIKTKPGVSLSKIQRDLRPKGFTPSLAGMKRIAIMCDLSWIE